MNCKEQSKKQAVEKGFSRVLLKCCFTSEILLEVLSGVCTAFQPWVTHLKWLFSHHTKVPNRKEKKNHSKNTLALEVIKRVNLHSHWQTKSFTQRQRDAPVGSFLVVLPSHSVHEKKKKKYMSNDPLWTYMVLCRRFFHSFISPTWTTKLSSPLPWMVNTISSHMQPKIHLSARSA